MIRFFFVKLDIRLTGGNLLYLWFVPFSPVHLYSIRILLRLRR